MAFQTIDEARKWLELKKVVKSADRVFPMNDEPLKIHEHDDRSSRDRKNLCSSINSDSFERRHRFVFV